MLGKIESKDSKAVYIYLSMKELLLILAIFLDSFLEYTVR
jgi:hypothetical protein